MQTDVRLIVGLALIAVASLAAQPGPAPDRLALVNATVVDVASGAVRPGQVVILAGGRIESIGTAPAPTGVTGCQPGRALR